MLILFFLASIPNLFDNFLEVRGDNRVKYNSKKMIKINLRSRKVKRIMPKYLRSKFNIE